jgi:hypothetical protein
MNRGEIWVTAFGMAAKVRTALLLTGALLIDDEMKRLCDALTARLKV